MDNSISSSSKSVAAAAGAAAAAPPAGRTCSAAAYLQPASDDTWRNIPFDKIQDGGLGAFSSCQFYR